MVQGSSGPPVAPEVALAMDIEQPWVAAELEDEDDDQPDLSIWQLFNSEASILHTALPADSRPYRIAIVVAADSNSAKSIHPTSLFVADLTHNGWRRGMQASKPEDNVAALHTWCRPDNVTVKYVGLADRKWLAGSVLCKEK